MFHKMPACSYAEPHANGHPVRIVAATSPLPRRAAQRRVSASWKNLRPSASTQTTDGPSQKPPFQAVRSVMPVESA